jgi:hypothetical protein
MPTEIRLWEIESEKPIAIHQQKLDLESRLEEWIVNDISLISHDLLIIGRQVPTEYGGVIDILAIDHDGNLVIFELKRDKTPRDVVAQILDYASNVQEWGADKVEEIAKTFTAEKTLDVAFREKFQAELPDVLNERHRMYIVASNLDAASERIVKYLSESHDIDINVVTFAFFKTARGEFLGRSFLLDEAQVETRTERKSKRKPPLTWEELESLVKDSNVLPLYRKAIQELGPLFDSASRTRSNVSLIGYMGDNKNGIVSIFPGASSRDLGLAIGINIKYLCAYFNIQESTVNQVIGEPNAEVKKRIDPLIYSGSYWVPCFSFTETTLVDFVRLLADAKKQITSA